LSSFFSKASVRETIESIIVAIILALMFKAYEAEAYIIPTGSMAPTLRGEHYDLVCPQCGHAYQTNCSPNLNAVRSTFCPLCRFRNVLKPEQLVDHDSFDGDRILVNKFIYDFTEPQRWEVIVFKNPKNAKQNYIKRLVGLPHESLLIENGDVHTFDTRTQSFVDRRIARKSPRKIQAMMQLVDDTQHIGSKLAAAGWPLRWVPVPGASDQESWTSDPKKSLSYTVDATGSANPLWLKYRHAIPQIEDWDALSSGKLPQRMKGLASGQVLGAGLVRDHYSYNEMISQSNNLGLETDLSGFHWVGDLGVEAWVQIQSDTGKLFLETTEGGAHFRCAIDIASGGVELDCSDSAVTWLDSAGKPAAGPGAGTCEIRGAGTHRLHFMNADDRLFVWVDGRPVRFGSQPFQDFRRAGEVVPRFTSTDPGDALPLAVGCQGGKARVSRLKVWRDVYYSATPGRGGSDYAIHIDQGLLNRILDDPGMWSTQAANELFASRRRGESDLRVLDDGQFFPLGDNSPASQDARVWGEPAYVNRDLLLGRALFLYWPHSLNRPIFGFPDFARMKFIR
jgi:signal peptidase I